ncbi:hypothetical protein M8371_32330, partial [Klebsiella pneumoniae]|nr:hypothetical protein [Klebsiella pneumoniae]
GLSGGVSAAGDFLAQPDEVRAGHGPLPGGKRLTAARQGYYGADYPARRSCACAGLGRDRAAGGTHGSRAGQEGDGQGDCGPAGVQLGCTTIRRR